MEMSGHVLKTPRDPRDPLTPRAAHHNPSMQQSAVSHVTQVAKDRDKILTAHKGDGEEHQAQRSTERHMKESAHTSQTMRQDEDSIDGILSSTRNPGQTTQIQAPLMLDRPPMYVNTGTCVWKCEWNQKCFNANHF